MTDPSHFHFSESGDRCNPHLLLLHGFLGCCHDWDDLMVQLCRDFHCLAVDLPGHGQTKTGDDELFSMEKCAEQLIALLDQLSIKSSHLLGYSMGGRLALYLALTWPGRFDKLILESASPGLKTEKERTQRQKHDLALAEKLRRVRMTEFLGDWYAQPLFESLHENQERFQELVNSRLQNDQCGLARSLVQMGTGSQPSLWDRLGELQNDLLLIVGENDNKFRAIGDEIASRIVSARLLIQPGCGHSPHFENPDRFVEHVSDFLIGSPK